MMDMGATSYIHIHTTVIPTSVIVALHHLHLPLHLLRLHPSFKSGAEWSSYPSFSFP